MTSEDDYFRASDSKIRFEVPALEGGIPRGLSLRDRATAILLLIITRRNRKKEAKLYSKIEAAIRADDQPKLMILYANLAILYQTAHGHTATLLDVCKQSIRLAERLHEWPFAAMMSYRAGDCAWDLSMSSLIDEHQQKSLHDEAVVLQKKALEYGEKAGEQSIIMNACERLSDLCEDTDPEFAGQMYDRYVELMTKDR